MLQHRGARILRWQRSLVTVLGVERGQYPQGNILLGRVCMLAESRTDITQPLILRSHADTLAVRADGYQVVEFFPVLELKELQRPIRTARFFEFAICHELRASSLDQILLEQYLDKSVGGDAALQLVEDILVARMRQDVLVAPEISELLPRRLSTIHFQ